MGWRRWSVLKPAKILLSGIVLVSIMMLLAGCLDLLCDVPLLQSHLNVHHYTNVILKSCHLLQAEGTRGAKLIKYEGPIGLGKGGSEQYPLDDTWISGQFTSKPEEHAEFFDRLYFQIWPSGYAVFDLGGYYWQVYVALSHDHGPYPEEALEYRIEISSDGLQFEELPSDTLIELYRRGWSALGENPFTGEVLPGVEPEGESGGSGSWPDVLNDDYTALWHLPKPTRFIKIKPLASFGPYDDPEIDAVIGLKPALNVEQISFIWPVLGLSVTDPLRNTQNPCNDGWYISNGFGEKWHDGSSPGGPDFPYHPGEDWNRKDGQDAGQGVYAIYDGEIIRSTPLGEKSGWGVIIRHTLPCEIDVSSFFLPNTTPKVTRTQIISSAYFHLNKPEFGEIDIRKGDRPKPIKKGELIGTIANIPLGPHLHFEIRINDSPLIADPNTSSSAYYRDLQSITDFGYIYPTKFLEAFIFCLKGEQ
jgi:murein DD-endopeptidase MepM/ murein hydrolase activator NlpD